MNSNKKIGGSKLWPLIVHTFFPLVLGGLIYLYTRDIDILYFTKWFGAIIVPKIFLPTWVRFNLPDFLWLYSFTSAYFIAYKNEQLLRGRFWKAIIPIIAFASEFMQSYNIIPGTYDDLDLMAYATAFIAVTIIQNNQIYKLKIF